MKKKRKNKKILKDLGKLKYILFFSFFGFVFLTFFVFVFLSKEKGTVSSIDFSSELEERVYGIVSGYPIQEMAPHIASKDRVVAAYIVAIAKKESNWGKHSPKKNGKTCYNYWGYRGAYNQTDSGYSCFDTPEQAVSVVGERIKNLVEKKFDTPKKMVLAWKCGFDCSSHSFFSVKKWEWDVEHYFKKVYY